MEYLLFFLIIGLVIFIPYKKFRNTKYTKASGNGYFDTMNDKGNYGEYLTFSVLKNVSGYKRLMTNLYIPTKDGKTTEIDLLLITETGLYVLESKNYSGWIYGDESNRYWTQTLPPKMHKYQFFNPIWQNSRHINALKQKLEIEGSLLKSYIIFSERCTLKKVHVHSPGVKVIKRPDLLKTVQNDTNNLDKILTPFNVDEVFAKLNKYARADATIKKVHSDQFKIKKKSGA
ncbi:nuclease-related domain-containing protein [Halalkalibacter okhensis]|uniref:NERD domain-containing protein n=1 Tax=Halalkalibacter okhensis TaxID=333138 RepID=A0A0B0IA94_9BACI|nr:nuclease-related domain-containing protein [Halalkalibacter okhensis]KHF39458.1 hypothetical protein LQ50_15500 [Halalkalibacter okhensis]